MLLLFLVASACGTTASPRSQAGPAEGTPSPGATQRVASTPYLSIPLTDLRTGERFTLGGFAGKTVVVEAMAVWCPLCTDQQRVMQGLLPELGAEVVFVSLDVDPNETAEIVRRYVERQGFAWGFAVAPRELAAALADAFGTQVLNPPATPIFIIDPKGRATLTPFGHKDASALRDAIRRARD